MGNVRQSTNNNVLQRRKFDDKCTSTDTVTYFGCATSMMTATHGPLMLVHDNRFTPVRGAWYHKDHIKEDEETGKLTITVPVRYLGCCQFKCCDEDQYESLSTMMKDSMDYEKVLTTDASADVPISIDIRQNTLALRRELVIFHDTVRQRCNLNDMTPCSV